jgi:hypothetical protein
MISANARITIRRLSLSQIIVVEYQERYIERLLLYIDKLKANPGDYAGIVFVEPTIIYRDIFALLDGYHKFCASIMAGRPDTLAAVIEEVED